MRKWSLNDLYYFLSALLKNFGVDKILYLLEALMMDHLVMKILDCVNS